MGPHITPSLPRSLLEELEIPGSHSGRKAAGQKLSRKQARRLERNEKKQRRVDFFAHRTSNGKRNAEDEHVDSPIRKKARLPTSSVSHKPTPLAKPPHRKASESDVPAGETLTTNALKKERRDVKAPQSLLAKPKQKTALQKLAERANASSPFSHPAKPSTKGRSQTETEEDAYISYLEKKLGWSKGGTRTKKYGAGLDEDGLDDLLQDLDTLEESIFTGKNGYSEGGMVEETKEGTEVDEEEDEEEGLSDAESDDNEIDDLVEDDDESDDDEENLNEEYHSAMSSSGNDPEEWTGFSASPEKDIAVVTEETVERPVPNSRYVPPHLRNLEGGDSHQDSEEQVKLTRQLKGLLNRLSEQNISIILDSIEEIYRKHRRHDVTSSVTTLIVDGISAHSTLLDSYVVLHAAFVSSLHKIIGVEFAAYFVQNVVASYERYYAALQGSPSSGVPDEEETRGKECLNLIVLLSELYNFQVISYVLVYDMIRGLLDGDLTELKVELLLKIVRSSGQQLRTDDPSSLKDIIQMVLSKLPAQQNAMSSRTRFMVETLANLKNNKVKKDGSIATTATAVDQMKKFLSGLSKKRHVRAHEPLRVTLADLHSAESKGKWWLIGAGWSGDPLVEQQDTREPQKKTESTENVMSKLAKKQGMNTDIRRSIFVVLMSSEDYVDACERLSQLKLTEIQQREIVRVILHCCGNEKSYNPYYAFVGQQLCRTSHSYKITLQFSLWDFLRDLGETTVGGAEVLKNLHDDSAVGFDIDKISSTRLRNVARAYAWWLAKDSCTLAILKPVDFTVLKPKTQKFFVELCTHLLVDTQLSTPLLSSDPKDYPITRNRGPLEEVFIKATRVQSLALGLVYFLGEHFLRKADEDGDTGFLSWAAKVAIGTLRTGVDVVSGL